MHCWKAILKSMETVCWSVSLVEDLEIRAHILTSFLNNFFSSSHMLGRLVAILEILLKSLSLTPKPKIKHIPQQQKNSHCLICIFFEPWLHFWIVGLAPLHPNFLFNLDFLSFSCPEQNSKHQKDRISVICCVRDVVKSKQFEYL